MNTHHDSCDCLECRLDRIPYPISAFHKLRFLATNVSVFTAVEQAIETHPYAVNQRDADLARLRSSMPARSVVSRLEDCTFERPCKSVACFVCARSYRLWLLPQLIAFAQSGIPALIVTVNLREVPIGVLHQISLPHERDALRKWIRGCGFTAAVGGFEVAYKPERGTWGFHVHLLVFGATGEGLELLQQRFKGQPTAVLAQVINSKDMVGQVTYLQKFMTTYHYKTRGPFPLPRPQLEELALWTSDLKFHDFAFRMGFQRRGAIIPGRDFHELLARRRLFRMALWRRGDPAFNGGPASANRRLPSVKPPPVKTSTRHAPPHRIQPIRLDEPTTERKRKLLRQSPPRRQE